MLCIPLNLTELNWPVLSTVSVAARSCRRRDAPAAGGAPDRGSSGRTRRYRVDAGEREGATNQRQRRRCNRRNAGVGGSGGCGEVAKLALRRGK